VSAARPRFGARAALLAACALAAPARAAAGAFALPSAEIERILAEIQAARSIPQTPTIIPVADFGDRRAARWRFRRRDEIFALDGDAPVSAGFEVSEVVETDDGAVERLLSVDGGAGASQLQARAVERERRRLAGEDERLRRLLADADAKLKAQKRARDDDRNVQTMVGEFPRALRYSFAGFETDANGERLVREDFASNDCSAPGHGEPCFSPSSQEARIYAGMKGTVWVRARDSHLVRLFTTIDQDVKFGWGPFSATAKRGGQISVALSDLDGSGRRWVLTALTVHLTVEKSAIASMFSGGTERDHDAQTMSAFAPAPALGYDDGIRLLLQPR
jgi:hypothetical protein